jgi:hypothetical protein
MLTVKAIVFDCNNRTANTPAPQKHFMLLTCDRILVRRWAGNSSDPRNEPTCEVELHDVAQGRFETLLVGPAIDHYQSIYVLNDRGRTVDAIHYDG